MTWFEVIAQIATDITACVAVYGYGSYRLTLHRRVRAVEKALSKRTQPNDNSLTIQQLAIELTLTEDQVIEAAGRSKIIESCTGQSGSEYRFRIRPKSN
jgi:hypothetical protein